MYLCISEVWAFDFHQHRVASAASIRNGAKIQHEFSWFCQKKFFPKHQNIVILLIKLLNSRTWMTLMTSLVLFPDLKNLWSLIDLGSLCNLNGLNSLYTSIPSKIILILMVWSSMAPKWPIIVIFFGMDHQKSNFSLIYGTISDGGCWGQPMLFFQNLVDETQMPKAQECTDNFILTKKLFLAGLRGLQSISNPVERPCTRWVGR